MTESVCQDPESCDDDNEPNPSVATSVGLLTSTPPQNSELASIQVSADNVQTDTSFAHGYHESFVAMLTDDSDVTATGASQVSAASRVPLPFPSLLPANLNEFEEESITRTKSRANKSKQSANETTEKVPAGKKRGKRQHPFSASDADNIHTADSFACPVCGQLCTSLKELVRHKATHTGGYL